MLIERVQEGKNNQQQIRILSRTTWELSTHTSPWDQMHCIQGSGDNWLMPFTRLLSIIFERLWRSDRSPDDWGNANIAHIFKKDKRKIQKITSWSASLWFLGKWWRKSSWKKFQGTGRRRTASMDLPRVNHAWTTSLPSWKKKITDFVDKGRAVDFIYLDLSRAFDNVSPQYSCIDWDKQWGWVGNQTA